MQSLTYFANANAAVETLKSGIMPVFNMMSILAASLCLLFVVFGGYLYVTSAGNPERIDRGKRVLRNAFIGLVVIIGASTISSFLQTSYNSRPVQEQAFSNGKEVTPPQGNEFKDFVNAAIMGFFKDAITSLGKPVIETVKQFTTATPYMAKNNAVFTLWALMVGLATVLFFGVIMMLGFKIMSATALGLEEIDLRAFWLHLTIAYLCICSSIFIIDAIIMVSNAMVSALLVGMSNDIIWTGLLTIIAASTSSIGVVLLTAFLVLLTIILLVYYLKRMIVLYVGAILSPLVFLLYLLPSFREFSVAATKRYIITIFIIFVHCAILALAVATFSEIYKEGANAFMSAIVGIATLLVLLGASRELDRMAIVSSGNTSMRKLGNTFVRSASHIASSVRQNPPSFGGLQNGKSNTPAFAASSPSSGSTRILSNASPDTNGKSAANSLKTMSMDVTSKKAAELLTQKNGANISIHKDPTSKAGMVKATYLGSRKKAK